MPAAVAIPENQDDVVALVRQARESKLALIPRGAGSGMPGGNVGNGGAPAGASIPVSQNFSVSGFRYPSPPSARPPPYR